MRAGHAFLLALVVFAAIPVGGSAQTEPPSGWKWVTDRPATLVTTGELPADGWHFVEMAPGWHVTMGPGGILFHPEYTVEGRFVVEAEIFLFPQPTDAGYGIFAGGDRLEAPDRSYFAFLARPDGAAGVFHYAGDEVHTLIDWARHAAVLPRADNDPVKNVLRMEAELDSLRFLVNGERVATLPRPPGLQGIVGLRMGEGVNVHTSNLDVTHRLAPTPPARQ